ncbi:hypothetical protein HPP92_022541 [Vanilla planifolia]|uniref:Uncharacterized protein n=1 Tax=Vanilla planifolia TaxID=51239 RepID=A0A835UFI2_VANPL|nr:hypothetical protein HPP92_022541 [Vanilla planifolia]
MHQLANLTFLAIENVASMYHYMKQQRQFNGRFTTLKAEPKEELISETVLQTVHFFASAADHHQFNLLFCGRHL